MNKQKKERIIAEQTAKRTRFTKVFRTENHGGMAAIYSRPVHYEEGGSWKEIDNRLAPSPENAEVYENRASGMKVRFAKKADAKALVTIKRNGKQVSWNFAAAAAGLGKGAARSAVNTDGNMPEFVLMPEEADTEPETAGVIEPDTESETVGVIEPDTESEKNDTGNRQKEEAAGSAEVKDQSPEAKNQAIEAENQAKMRIPGLTSGGTYKEIAPGIDLTYTLIGETLKEYLVLKTPEAAAVPLAFTISHKGLDLVPTADGGIDVKDEEGILFTFVPPCMYDGAGNVSNEVRYETRISAEESTLTVVPSMEWLQAPERSYPVLVDPTAETVKSTKNIEDTFVQEKSPDSAFPANNGSFTVGNNASYSRCRTLLKFRELPALENGAVIYNARIYVWQYRFSSNTGADFYITAHKVNGSWYSGTATWNNQPSYDSTVLSYDKVGQVQSGSQIAITPRSFDVTRLVREWYNTGVNNGILLKAENEGMKQEAVFVSSDYPTPNSYGITSDQYPSGVFYYRSTSGLEDYYSYHERALGRAGTGYVNDFNGNLVYVHEDTGTSGELLPIGIRHVYNLSDRSTDGRIGKGWRLNFIREMAGTGKSDFPYVYTDEDGTRHYFYKDTADGNKLKDEDGLGFTLTQTSSSDFDSYYIMKDKDDYQYVFGQDHFMRSITDPNGNIQKAQYGPSSDGNYLAWITDPTGAQVKFGYLSSGKLSYVEANGRKVSYSYDSSGHLTRITYPDGKRTELLYSGDLLTRVQRPDGRAINYAYVNDCKVQRVSEIREALGPENGQILKISYRNGSTTVFEEQGLDGSISSTADNRKYTCHFDNYGSPADISDGDGFANSYRYYREGMKNNKLSHTGSLQRSVRNLLKNQSFVVNDSTWGKQIPSASGNSITRATSGGYLGDHSMKIVKADTSGDGVVTQQVSLAAGTYTLSAYVKTQSVTASSGGGAGLSVKYDSTTMKSRTMLTGTTDTAVDKGWERLAVTFTLSAAKTVTVSAGLFTAKGTAYVTCCQLEKGSIANKYNLVYNAGFQSAFGSATGNWEVKGSGSGDGQVTDSVRGTCGGLKGSITGEKYLKQAVNVRGTEGDVFTLGCWVKASAVPGKNFRLRAAIIYDTGNPKWVDIDCNPYVEEWQYVSGVILTYDEDSATEKRTYNAIHLFLAYDNQANQAYFSDIQLVKDDGESFVYDAKGNVASAKTAAEESGFTYDQKENLTRLADVTGSAFEYGYDSKHNLLSARNSEGVGYYYVLNAKGQPTILRARNDRMTTSITAGRTYLIRNRKSGKYLEVAYGTDADGTNVQQGDFNGSSAQKWKVVDSGGGYVRLVSATGSRVLTVHNSADVINTNIELMTDAKTDGQLLRISSKGYTCVLCPKCSGDKKVLDVHGASNEGGANVILANQNESRNSQQWYFEPAENVGTDTLAAGRTYAIRLRHSGQYMAVKDNSTSVGAPIIQAWYNGKNYEYFRINTAGGGQYSLEPVSASGKALSLSDANVLTLANKDTTDPHQRFTFVKRDTVYSIVGASGAHLEAADASYTFTAAVRGTTVTGEPGTHQSFILEECSDRLEAFAAYTATGRNIASVKNTRGYTTRYSYDADDRLLTGVTDAKGNTVHYAYEANTDRLIKVSAAVGSQTVENTYSYDDADRLSAIGHNGFTYQFSYDSFDNLTKVTAGGTTLSERTYLASNGPLSEVRYGNGNVLKNTYDKQQRVTEQKWENASAFRFTYDDFGQLQSHSDLLNNVVYEYRYDLLHRLAGMRATNGQEIRVAYDAKNRVSAVTQKVGSESVKTSYLYGDVSKGERPGLSYGLQVAGSTRASYTYDSLARMTGKTLRLDGKDYAIRYTYLPGTGAGVTTMLINSISSGGKTLTYTYDAVGNITAIAENGTNKAKYTYDALSRLTRADSVWENKSVVYAYDVGGNLTSRKEYAYTTGTLGTVQKTIPYGYRASGWKDQLTSYNGQTITYDNGGNPLTWRGMTLTWKYGRRLATLKKGTATAAYAYDNEGHRVSRTDLDGTTYTYYWNGDQVMAMKKGNTLVHFVYDQAGNLFAMRTGGKYYYYLYNLQNDVIGLLDSSGNQVVSYVYDSWGKPVSMTDTSGSGAGSLNPFWYREYCWDEDTGLYYVMSRYYDPEVCRFINADDAKFVLTSPMTLREKNLYAYCDDNSVGRKDIGGAFWETAIDVISLGASVVEVAVNPTDPLAWAGLVGDAIDLLPFVTGVGETTKAITETIKAVDKADDIIDTAKTINLASDIRDIRKGFGSYEIFYDTGISYVGKGGFNRAIKSATEHKGTVTAIKWKSAPSAKEAFIDEYMMQCRRISKIKEGNFGKAKKTLHNKIWSPGRKLYYQKYKAVLK